MRFGRQTHSLQCLALGDSRSLLCDRGNGRSLFFSTSTPTINLRRGYSSQRIVPLINRRTRYPVIRNSLKKTLEAQRTVNRERLIRKVYNEPVEGVQDTVRDARLEANEPITEGLTKAKPSKQIKSKRPSTVIHKPSHVPWVAPLQDGLAQQPWLGFIQRSERWKINARSTLNNEISALAEYLKPSDTEQAVVNEIVDDVSSQLQGVVPSSPQLVGSRPTQLASSNSTVDLMILVPHTHAPDSPHHKPAPMNPRISKSFADVITRAELAMKNSDTFNHCHVIHDKSPALVMSHKTSDLSIRLFCRTNSPRSDDFMRNTLAELPSILPLYMVTRVLLESKALFGWGAASLDSYSLFLLITSFLRQNTDCQRLGEQLLSFLHTYGTQINLSITGISVSPAEFFTPSTIREHERSISSNKTTYPAYLIGQRALMRYKINASNKANLPAARHLCIQDPTNYLNDAGLRCLRTTELQETFSGLYTDLQMALERWSGGNVLGQVLRADFGELVRRKNLGIFYMSLF
ncbi:conserved hypothetical protein [Talaromyces stipitatus ATCC 10500]|uniref:Polynucleotide adenylyltransferase n=1 Tax=Talaromyces stipitatus (strain ATCC 10500 / CBS 375.48 / QM 6759 / NRRL 1006) TaxID=441959 RepID=B8MNN8_TALSN|nr:uncharacterized protein TSTA_103490 [Talaromyces stipitatus ATCC 10500]EED14127.1 conserved hypothetical protein [Talaromyces stipitatus ATCC 10500]